MVDTNNSSVAMVGAGSFFVGTPTSTLGVSGIQVSLKADQNCIVFIAQMPDNSLHTGKGTVATNDSAILTGTGTQFTKDFVVGDTVVFDPAPGTPQTKVVASVVSDTVLTVTVYFSGGSLTGKAYQHYAFDLRDQYNYVANGNFGMTVQAINAYVRVRVQNIGAATTQVFRLETALCPIVESIPRSLDRNANLKIATPIDYSGFLQDNTPNNEAVTTSKIRLTGTIFDGSTIDANFYTLAVSTGTVVQTGSELILTSGTASPNYARVYTNRRARWVTGTTNKYRAQMRFGDAGTANVNRRWGIGWGTSMPTVTDGAYFKLYGTTFTIATMDNTNEREVAQGSFNGDFGPTYTPPNLTQNTTYEILYTLGNIYFFVGGTLLHKASYNTTHWTYNTTTFHAFADVNNTGASAAVTMTFRMMNISRYGHISTIPTSKYQTGTTGSIYKRGAGNIHTMIIGAAANGAVITVYDGITTGGTVVWSSTITFPGGGNFNPVSLDFSFLPFYTGLYIDVTTASATITTIYE